MAVHEFSRADARRIAVRAQLLDSRRPTELLGVVRRLTLLQIDPTAAIAPNADLVAWIRLGSPYSPAKLDAALDKRTLLELRAMIRPGEDIALYRAEMAAWRSGVDVRGPRASQRNWLRANDACRREILDRLAGRRGAERLWDVAERVYPGDPAIPAGEAFRIRNERRLRALGIARARGPECAVEPVDVAEVGEPAVVEGVRGTWRVDPSQLGQPFSGRAALLSPFDRLIHDRKRTLEIFEFDYQLEMYKPAAQRRWGYFACRSCSATVWLGSSMPLPTANPACSASLPFTRTCHSTRRHDRRGAPRDHGPGPLARTGLT